MPSLLALLILTGPDCQEIDVVADAIVSLRIVRHHDHQPVAAHCNVFTLDGKFIAVTQTCAQVRQQWKDAVRSGAGGN